MRLIDADALIKELQETKVYAFGSDWQKQIEIADKLIDILNDTPTASTTSQELIFDKAEDWTEEDLLAWQKLIEHKEGG